MRKCEWRDVRLPAGIRQGSPESLVYNCNAPATHKTDNGMDVCAHHFEVYNRNTEDAEAGQVPRSIKVMQGEQSLNAWRIFRGNNG